MYSFLLEHMQTDLDKHSVHMIMITHLEAQQRYGDMISLTIDCLRTFGIDIPSEPEAMKEMLQREVALVKQNLAGREIEDLLAAPEIIREKDLAIMQLLQALWTPSYAGSFILLSLLVGVLGANYSMQHGNCEGSPIIYMGYAFFSGDYTGNVHVYVFFSVHNLFLLL